MHAITTDKFYIWVHGGLNEITVIQSCKSHAVAKKFTDQALDLYFGERDKLQWSNNVILFLRICMQLLLSKLVQVFSGDCTQQPLASLVFYSMSAA